MEKINHGWSYLRSFDKGFSCFRLLSWLCWSALKFSQLSELFSSKWRLEARDSACPAERLGTREMFVCWRERRRWPQLSGFPLQLEFFFFFFPSPPPRVVFEVRVGDRDRGRADFKGVTVISSFLKVKFVI